MSWICFSNDYQPREERSPHIDVDFEHQRREEVIQYIYQKYGRETCWHDGCLQPLIEFVLRFAIVERFLGISLDRIDALAKIVDGRGYSEAKVMSRTMAIKELGERTSHFYAEDHCPSCWYRSRFIDWQERFLYLVSNPGRFSRHLSQHTV